MLQGPTWPSPSPLSQIRLQKFVQILPPMANLKINNLAVSAALVSNPVREGRYNTEDISPLEKAYILKHTPKPRVARADLKAGNVVVVLEGAYMGRRAVYIERFAGHTAVLFCITSGGASAFFKIDERYLFKLGTSIELPRNLNLDADSLHESVLGEPEKLDVEAADAEAGASSAILDAISKVKFMRSYLSGDFKADHSVEFYSQEY